MENVLEAYHRPYDEKRPVIRMDEQPVQMLGEAREPIPVNEHHSKREGSEYVGKGTRGVFMFAEPLGGRRFVTAADGGGLGAGSEEDSHGRISPGGEGGDGEGII